ncbi:PEP-CTERM sorting domain-containing protein [Scytonema sp. UIC 10036]|uniref:PEP-CTERM sorting domain-containing protein n=1 Tax=Scytonema sp. UIC 10036 TaxID=2304196 RepID=UPI0012DA8976|nr:PEP-CTERM sorting domain-containing protein [Scytonema sp. UIC 10036]MUG93863.1 PEP-CTERM sorting domain-containing protein [Scytonema sp. UIC 10036]
MNTSILVNSESENVTSFQSAIINGGFDTGSFTGWSTSGMSFVDKSELENIPSKGIYSALLLTGAAEDGELNVFSDSVIESFLSLPNGTLDALIGKDTIEGSAIQQTFAAKAGDRLSFDWNFFTNESISEDFNDFAFVTINGVAFKLSDTFSSLFSSSSNDFDTETGLNTFSYTVAEPGNLTLGFGVLDVGDTMIGSGLLIDNLKLESSISDSAITIM